jgi:hypothetical protein
MASKAIVPVVSAVVAFEGVAYAPETDILR